MTQRTPGWWSRLLPALDRAQWIARSAVALLAAVCLTAVKGCFDALVASERESRDIVARLGADTAQGPRDRAMVLVDIDDLTYRAWGRQRSRPATSCSA